MLYRRWPSRTELLHAAIQHRCAREALRVPDTGSLRGDVLALLKAANRQGNSIAALLSAHLAAYYCETGQTPAKAIEALRVEAARAMMETSRHPVEVVARETGFGDRERMRQAFLRAFGQPPQAMQQVLFNPG